METNSKIKGRNVNYLSHEKINTRCSYLWGSGAVLCSSWLRLLLAEFKEEICKKHQIKAWTCDSGYLKKKRKVNYLSCGTEIKWNNLVKWLYFTLFFKKFLCVWKVILRAFKCTTNYLYTTHTFSRILRQI